MTRTPPAKGMRGTLAIVSASTRAASSWASLPTWGLISVLGAGGVS